MNGYKTGEFHATASIRRQRADARIDGLRNRTGGDPIAPDLAAAPPPDPAGGLTVAEADALSQWHDQRLAHGWTAAGRQSLSWHERARQAR